MVLLPMAHQGQKNTSEISEGILHWHRGKQVHNHCQKEVKYPTIPDFRVPNIKIKQGSSITYMTYCKGLSNFFLVISIIMQMQILYRSECQRPNPRLEGEVETGEP